MRRLLPLLTALAALALAPSAQAVWYGADALDGPADIRSVADADLGRDGDGGVVYLKAEGGVPQVFLTRMIDGAWQPPERLSSGPAVTEAAITANIGGRMAIAWIAAGNVFATVVPAAGPPPHRGRAARRRRRGPRGGRHGLQRRCVRRVGAGRRRARGAAGGHDLDAARRRAGHRSRAHGGRAARGRRAPRATPSRSGRRAARTAAPTSTSAASPGPTRPLPAGSDARHFEGQPGGSASAPDIDVELDGSFAWAVFQQEIGGRSRAIARRLLGSQFEAPAAIDGGQTATAPRIDFAGKGIGGAVAQSAEGGVIGAYLDKFDAFQPGVRIDAAPGASPPAPVIATSEREDVYTAWAHDGSVQARRKDGEGAWEPEFQAAAPAFGPVSAGPIGIGSDRSGNTVVAMVQGPAGAGRLTAAVYDRLPGTPVILNTTKYRARRPTLRWSPGSENWGVQTFTLLIDGKAVGRTTGTTLKSTKPFGRGTHRYQVVTTDRRGQTASVACARSAWTPGCRACACG